MKNAVVEPLTAAGLAGALDLASRMRPVDAREVWAVGGQTPEEAVRDSLEASLVPRGQARVVRLGALPVMLFGVAPCSVLSDAGSPWMLASAEWDAALSAGLSRTFLRRCRGELIGLGREFSRLENQVLADNAAAARWLEWMGFHLDPPAPFGVRGELCRKFWKE